MTDTTFAPVKLHSLGGRAAPPDLVEDFRRVARLPYAAGERLWDVLGPSLLDPIPREIEGIVERFAREHELAGDDLPRALRGCRALFRAASKLDVGPAQLTEDLARLCGGADGGGDTLARGYPRARAAVRAELARRTLAEQGKLLEEIRWRVDSEWSSDRVMGLRLPVVTLTLCYREGEERGQLTVQVLPDVLRDLQSLCARVLAAKKS